VEQYFADLASVIAGVEITDAAGQSLSREAGCERVQAVAHAAHDRGNKIMLIGNGGSAAIASHLATDFARTVGLRAQSLNDPAILTCLGNDFGYDSVFAKQMEFHAREGDLLIAISSSGRSQNILSAVAGARAGRCGVVTFSGFAPDNALRRSGDVNYYVASSAYGFVEIAHLALCHAIIDLDPRARRAR
jgi:D-sedoheptulose 7-phosphate isomerase